MDVLIGIELCETRIEDSNQVITNRNCEYPFLKLNLTFFTIMNNRQLKVQLSIKNSFENTMTT